MSVMTSSPLGGLRQARAVADTQEERVESRRRVVNAARWMLDEWPYTSTLAMTELIIETREACGDADLTDEEVARAVSVATGA